MEFSCRCHSTTGGITSSTLLPWVMGSWWYLPMFVDFLIDTAKDGKVCVYNKDYRDLQFIPLS